MAILFSPNYYSVFQFHLFNNVIFPDDLKFPFIISKFEFILWPFLHFCFIRLSVEETHLEFYVSHI